jgi:addiction module HigA family antidote
MSRFTLPTNRPPTHPGEMLLEDFLKPFGVSQAMFADRIGVSYVRLNAVVNGRRGVTPDTALRLERATGMDADFWLDLQTRWDLWHAMRSPGARDIESIERLSALR